MTSGFSQSPQEGLLLAFEHIALRQNAEKRTKRWRARNLTQRCAKKVVCSTLRQRADVPTSAILPNETCQAWTWSEVDSSIMTTGVKRETKEVLIPSHPSAYQRSEVHSEEPTPCMVLWVDPDGRGDEDNLFRVQGGSAPYA